MSLCVDGSRDWAVDSFVWSSTMAVVALSTVEIMATLCGCKILLFIAAVRRLKRPQRGPDSLHTNF